ncbi:MAG: UDP-N-acetylmuramoyl-L-alanyl-D-glutamate--2,6-diaminopimelate ligase [Clostridiales bacterium]|nr:UDP-N-acetylmuramoyl-L-alanyl-D-glutamate--2,6-diaminopimelate ligase [Clostridiales bacterium]
MRLKKILENVEIVKIINNKNINIKSITHISSDVIKDSMFICLKGENFDGNNYALEVVKNGAKCIVTENENIDTLNAVIVVVKDVRKAMSLIAKNYYYKCVDDMEVCCIVGTSGKTTTSHMLMQLLSKIDNNVGVIGTNGIYIGNIFQDNKFTTPDPLELHYIFYQMKMLGVKRVIMEVSAQAIYYQKITGIKFKYGVFTNISAEHLDFFKSMEDYVRCKMSFFKSENMKECVINIDDFYGMELAYKSNIPCVSVGIKNPANSFAVDIKSSLNGSIFTANILDEIYSVDCSFVGEFNIYNLLTAMTVAKMWGVSQEQITNVIKNMKAIPGRFNVYHKGDNLIAIDFAHTSDSIDKILHFVRCNTDAKIITLFGCVGYSDLEKRIAIAKSVDRSSDYLVITTDNRGDVSFDEIACDIEKGIFKCDYVKIEDRESAIKYAIDNLKNDDVLLILGKGAENFQKINGERIKYSDIEVVERYLKEKL